MTEVQLLIGGVTIADKKLDLCNSHSHDRFLFLEFVFFLPSISLNTSPAM